MRYGIFAKHCPAGNGRTVNNTAGPNGLVLILLIFGAIFEIIMDLLRILNQIKRAAVNDKIIINLRKFTAKKAKPRVNRRKRPEFVGLISTYVRLKRRKISIPKKNN